jgi:hypothetical protein
MSKNGCPIAVLVLGVIFSLLVPAAQAQKTTAWSGAGGDNLWANPANWTNGVPSDNVADKVHINGTVGSPFVVNLNGASIMVRLNQFVVNYATITNGTWDWDGGAGSLAATNVTFASNARLYRVCRSIAFSNVTYNNESYAFVVTGDSGTHRYMGGYIQTAWGFQTTPQYGSSVISTIIFDGYGGPDGSYHYGKNWNRIGSETADNGQSFFILNNTRVRSGRSLGIGWNGTSANKGQSTFACTNSQVYLGQELFLNTNATLSVSNSTFSFNSYASTDGLYNRMTNAALFDGEGLTIGMFTDNAGQQYEVSGVDTGAVFAGFLDNYSIDQFKFGLRDTSHTTPFVAFTNKYDNNIQPGNEALYVDVLTEVDNTGKAGADPKFTLNLNGFNVYYMKYVDSTNVPVVVTNGTLTQVTGAAFFPASGFVHAPEGVKSFSRGDAPLAIGTDYGSVYVRGFAAGKALSMKLAVSGTQPNIDTLRADLGGSGSGGQITLSYPQGGNGGTMFFGWNFSHRSVSLTSLDVGESVPGTMMIIR